MHTQDDGAFIFFCYARSIVYEHMLIPFDFVYLKFS